MFHKSKLLTLAFFILVLSGCTTVSSSSDMKTLKAKIPNSVFGECSTNSSTFFETTLRINNNITNDQKRSAITKALGVPSSNPNFAVKTFKGQWFLEYETKNAMFVSYKIRSHYLQVAVIYIDKGLETIICDSRNLKQSDSSIHKKAPVWKETLNSKIRAELQTIALD